MAREFFFDFVTPSFWVHYRGTGCVKTKILREEICLDWPEFREALVPRQPLLLAKCRSVLDDLPWIILAHIFSGSGLTFSDLENVCLAFYADNHERKLVFYNLAEPIYGISDRLYGTYSTLYRLSMFIGFIIVSGY